MADIAEDLERLGDVDVCFVIDTTSSMGPFIEDAKRHARAEALRIASSGDLHVRAALVEYRDHPPQDHSFVERHVEFADLDRFQLAVNELQPYGGGDIPEAVYDGLYAAAGLQWRENAEHLCYLIGDAPPHGVPGYEPAATTPDVIMVGAFGGDGFPAGCPCGITARGILEIFSMHSITLHACAIGGDPRTKAEFTELADGTGGKCFDIEVTTPEAVTHSFAATLASTSGDIGSGRAVYAAYSAAPTSSVAEISASTGLSESAVNSSLGYLRKRGISWGTPKEPDVKA